MFENYLAFEINNAQNGNGWDFVSIIRKHGKSGGHVQQTPIATAQRQGQAVVWSRETGDAQAFGHAHHAILLRCVRVVIDINKVQRFYSRDVERIGKRGTDSDRAMESSIVVDGAIRFTRVV